MELLWARLRSRKARQLEMDYYDKMHVFDKVAYCSMLGEDRQGAPESNMG